MTKSTSSCRVTLRYRDYLGITIVTMCRVLSDLKRRGVVDVSAHSITLLDRFALEAIGED